MQRKAQLTFIVIVGLIVLIIVGGAFYVRNIVLKEQAGIGLRKDTVLLSDVRKVRSFLDSCVKDVGEQALLVIGSQGGYVNLPRYAYALDLFYSIPYHYYDKRNIMPSINKIENEISSFIEENFNECTNNFQEFPSLKVIEKGNVQVKTRILEDKVIISVSKPMTIEKENNQFNFIDKNSQEFPIRLNKIYSIARLSTEEQVKNNGDLCLGCLASIAKRENLDFTLFTYEPHTVVFIVHDGKSFIKNEPYQFIFASKVR